MMIRSVSLNLFSFFFFLFVFLKCLEKFVNQLLFGVSGLLVEEITVNILDNNVYILQLHT
jgi:hypothetical protein